MKTKDIPGYEKLYYATIEGEVYSHDKVYPMPRNRGFGTYKGKKLTQTIHGGYCYVSLCRKGKGKSTLVHRIIAMTFIQNPENKPQVNHINGIKTENMVENLEWVTQSENAKHAYENRLNTPPSPRKGSKHEGAKLKEHQVLEIRDRLKNGVTTVALAKEFGMDQTTMSNIKVRKTWKHI